MLIFSEDLEIPVKFEAICKRTLYYYSITYSAKLFLGFNRHDVTNATRDLIKDSTQDLKLLASYQPLDSKKSVNKSGSLLPCTLTKDLFSVKDDWSSKNSPKTSKGSWLPFKRCRGIRLVSNVSTSIKLKQLRSCYNHKLRK